MCTTAAPALLLVLLASTLTTLMMHQDRLFAHGLPVHRREREANAPDDLLSGKDFLSVFLGSSMRKPREDAVTERPEDATGFEQTPRTSREAPFEDQTTEVEPPSTSSDGVVIAVRVSSSIEPNIAKSELNEPMTAKRDYPGLVQNFPAGFNLTDLIKRDGPPFHHSFIYHDDPQQPGRARSVSYSTIIQSVGGNAKLPVAHGRQERHYDGSVGFRNSLDNDTKTQISSTSSTTTEKPWTPSPKIYGRSEQNYEIDESVSLETNGRTHGVQTSTKSIPEIKDDNDKKTGYVVEGRNYRKYRVEERTADGFIVGEYGVVSNDDGSLRGVRYTADGTINPRLIYDALMKFLSL